MPGEIAEMMLNGTMCQGCGEFLHDGADGPGYPGFCAGCAPDEDLSAEHAPSGGQSAKKKAFCPLCSKRFKTAHACFQHISDKHGHAVFAAAELAIAKAEGRP